MRLRAALALAAAVLACGAAERPLAAQSPTPAPFPGWSRPGASDAVLATAPDGAVLHRNSGYRFAAALGPMAMSQTAVLGPRDVMVGYGDHGGHHGDPWLDLIVYDYGHPLDVEAKNAEADIRRVWTDLAPAPGVIRMPARATSGRSLWWRGDLRGARLLTGFVMVQRGPWIIEARVSCPEGSGDAGFAKVQAALDAITWELDGLAV